MALKGKLKDFSLTQLLNLVHLARKTGALSVESGSSAAQLFFQDGKLVYASVAGQANGLAELMHQAGKLTARQVEAINASGRNRDDKQLGLLLINAGQVKREEIITALRQSMTRVIEYVYGWDDGAFIFDQKMIPPGGRITFPMSLDTIMLEGNRRRQEARSVQTELPSLEVVLKFAEGKNLRSVNLSVDEWRVISFVNPRNTVATIAQYNQMSEVEVRRIVSKLMRDGLVEVAGGLGRATPQPSPGRSAAPVAAPQPAPAVQAVAEADMIRPDYQRPDVDRNIIRRLIQRIRGL